MSKELLVKLVDESKEVFGSLYSQEKEINLIGREIKKALDNSKKVLTCGNGGSATDAEHLSQELVARYRKDNFHLPSFALTTNSGVLTCIGNDYSYDEIFSRQVSAMGQAGDILVCFSTSGNSPNILRALEVAKARGVRTISLLGKSGGKAKGVADHEIVVASDNTARIQEVHTFLLHYFCEIVEA